MNSPFINLLAMALYLSVAYLLWRDLRRGARTAGAARLGIFTLAAGAVLLHGAILYSGFLRENALDLGLTNAISLYISIVIGGLTVTGSAIAWGKLSEKITGKPSKVLRCTCASEPPRLTW